MFFVGFYPIARRFGKKSKASTYSLHVRLMKKLKQTGVIVFIH
ncbi:hypothetical protein KKH3_28870 [Pectobacterium actinidiae]|nr:hypothetical protein KKH3_28870 [Pectobacterium actinidiae]